MKILHIGGYHPVTQALVKYQLAAGHEVQVAGSGDSLSYLLPATSNRDIPVAMRTAIKAGFDIIQFHLAESLLSFCEIKAGRLTPILEHFKTGSALLFLFSYGDDPLASPNTWAELEIADLELKEIFKHAFIGSPDNADAARFAQRWSWLGVPIDLETTPTPSIRQPAPGDFRMLHIPFGSARADTPRISACIDELRRRDLKFNWNMPETSSIHNQAELDAVLQDADMLIEQLTHQSFGFLALRAMAMGKTVLSGNSSTARSRWEQLATCPVVDTNTENLEKRLVSIMREPRCLRDFGKRSRQYVERFHNASVISRIMLDTYQRSLMGG